MKRRMRTRPSAMRQSGRALSRRSRLRMWTGAGRSLRTRWRLFSFRLCWVRLCISSGSTAASLPHTESRGIDFPPQLNVPSAALVCADIAGPPPLGVVTGRRYPRDSCLESFWRRRKITVLRGALPVAPFFRQAAIRFLCVAHDARMMVLIVLAADGLNALLKSRMAEIFRPFKIAARVRKANVALRVIAAIGGASLWPFRGQEPCASDELGRKA